MSISSEHHQLNRDIIRHTRTLMTGEPTIHLRGAELGYDAFTVPDGYLDGIIEAIDINDRKIACLEEMTRAMAAALRELIAVGRPSPNIDVMRQILDRVESTL